VIKVTAVDKDKTNKGDIEYGLVAGKMFPDISFPFYR
jgi:hypothetical protein